MLTYIFKSLLVILSWRHVFFHIQRIWQTKDTCFAFNFHKSKYYCHLFYFFWKYQKIVIHTDYGKYKIPEAITVNGSNNVAGYLPILPMNVVTEKYLKYNAKLENDAVKYSHFTIPILLYQKSYLISVYLNCV